FLDRRILETAQDRHRDSRRRDRGRKGKTGLETEVHIGRREHQRDDDSYDYPATGKFLAHIRLMFADQRERRIVRNRRKGQDDVALAEVEYFNARNRKDTDKSQRRLLG